MNPGCAAEQAAWREVKGGWRPLYGDVDKIGVAIEWHDFRIGRSFNWGRTFHPNSLEFCLNLSGHGAVGRAARTRSDYLPGNCGYYAVGKEPLPASRDRKSTRLNSSHSSISYAVFCLKKKNNKTKITISVDY